MKELEQILRIHAARYPAMEPADAVKLIYQNEFGGGHLIRDREAARSYLYREYEAVARDPSKPRYEDIGNGILRVNLASISEEELTTLFDAFVFSAEIHRGDPDSFRSKLQILRKLTSAGVFSFDTEALEQYLEGYARAGFPAVSHSALYRELYSPAYRIVRQDTVCIEK